MPFFNKQNWPEYQHRPLLFIDLEMTGLDVSKHEIIEVAALVVEHPSLSILKSYYTKVLPTHSETADPEALRITQYSPGTWKEAISLRQVLLDLSQLAPYSILAGYSVQNEWDFLLAALEKEQLPCFFDNHLIEVWTMAFAKYFRTSDIGRLGLTYLCQQMGINLERHKPESDIRATYEIFKRLINENPA